MVLKLIVLDVLLMVIVVSMWWLLLMIIKVVCMVRLCNCLSVNGCVNVFVNYSKGFWCIDWVLVVFIGNGVRVVFECNEWVGGLCIVLSS